MWPPIVLPKRGLVPGFFVEARQIVEIRLDAWRIFDDPLASLHGYPRIHRPRPGKDLRILDGRLIVQRVAGARDPFDDLDLVAVEPAVDTDARFIDEADGFHDERGAFPAADGIPVVRVADRQRHDVMGGADGHLTKRVAGPELIQKDDRHAGRLHDRMRRPEARHAARLAEERGVELALLLREVLDLRLQLRLVRRLIGLRVRLLRVAPVAPFDDP